MSDYKVNLVNEEQPSIAEKEEQVLESAGVDTKQDDGVYRVDLSKPPKTKEDTIREQIADDASTSEKTEVGEEVGEEVQASEEPTEQEEPIIELIKEESNAEEVQQGQEELQQEVVADPIDLPENIQKVVDFMKETGGTLEDYVRLNTDYSSVDEKTLLKEYYKQTKSHLDNEEIDFLIEDNFSFDEDLDEERDIKRKKLAYKEELTKARNFLGDLKSKYYDEVKMTSRLAPEQKEAIEFYNQYKQQQEELTAAQAKQSEAFVKQTENVFNQEFKGFDFSVGENKYRFKVQDVEQTKKAQSDIVEVFGKFLDENNMLKDASGYHKALFAARNADKIANHFYEQGRAEAIKEIEAKAKNINMDPRKTNQCFVEAGGVKVRAVSGEDSSKLRIKIKQ